MTIEIQIGGAEAQSLSLATECLEAGALAVRGPALIFIYSGQVLLRASGIEARCLESELLLLPQGRGLSLNSEGQALCLVARYDEELLDSLAAALAALLPEDAFRGLKREGGEIRLGIQARPAEARAVMRAAEALLCEEGRGGCETREDSDSASMRSLLAAELFLAASQAASRSSPGIEARLEARVDARVDAKDPRPKARAIEAVRHPPPTPEGPWSIEEAIRHIESHYEEAFSLEFFVSRCALNTSDFSRRFKEKAGCPLFEFINRQRVRRACSLLKDGELPIIEIALAVGYNNLSFFNRYFQKIMSVTPREYRAASRRG